MQGSRGLAIESPPESLKLIVSNGLVMDSPLSSGKPWTLGEYVSELGGTQVRGKRTFGICLPDDKEGDDESTEMEVSELEMCVN